MNNKLANKLIQLKSDIESSKEKKSRLEGKQESLLSKLREEFDCKSIKEAEKKEKQMQTNYDKLGEQLEKEINSIEGIMEKNNE